MKTVSAFSNYNDGTSLFGVDGDSNVKGLSDVKQACLNIGNKINDSISPQQNYTLEIQNNDQTIKITIKSAILSSIGLSLVSMMPCKKRLDFSSWSQKKE